MTVLSPEDGVEVEQLRQEVSQQRWRTRHLQTGTERQMRTRLR